MEELARTHLRTVTNHYQRDSLTHQGLKVTLRQCLGCKAGVSLLGDQVASRSTACRAYVGAPWHRLKVLHLMTVATYYTAKHTVANIYCDSATAMGLMQCYKQLTYRTQELYHIRQYYTQTVMSHTLDWTYRTRLVSHAHQTKTRTI